MARTAPWSATERAEIPANGASMSPRHRRALTLSIGLAALLYLAFVLLADRAAVLAALRRVGSPVLTAIFALSLLNYLLRFWRWRGYIAAFGHVLPWRRHFLYYLAGFTLTVTPGKAGEAVRSLYLRGHGVSYAQSLAALFAERLLDVLAMSLLALLILLVRPDYAWLVAIAWASVLMLGWLVTRPWLPDRLRGWGNGHRYGHPLDRLARLLDAAAVLLRPGYFLFGLGLGVLSWGLEGFSLYLIARAIGVELSLAAGIGIYAIAVLAGALSFLPGGLGGTEAVMGGLLVAFGADGAVAVAITLLCRIATLWFAVVLGGVAVAMLSLDGQRTDDLGKD
ncbi:MAG: lysylphosphatidylglycerol synthase transmembrane domain-containing protein [Candidatus Contendobacter sp.]|nr:lysylphosphatidylglycerol synthase transmembrane domain-containing protein [Candidatus Contendobacter sp.]MDG4556429.1 lysylphosphatidylglycerol synthase transmembrane domain-containing protein [Candidatus Contendobacter sp.]